jgi:hypothetical protein
LFVFNYKFKSLRLALFCIAFDNYIVTINKGGWDEQEAIYIINVSIRKRPQDISKTNKGVIMLVSDLIEELKNYPEDTEVHISYNYGDHWGTQVAPVISNVEQQNVKYSDYHSMDAITEDECDEDEDSDEGTCNSRHSRNKNTRTVVVLS